MSLIKVDGIWIEDLFDWAFETAHRDGGDGGCAIICKNFKETAAAYDKYLRSKFDWYEKFPLEKSVDTDTEVFLGIDQEYHCFTNKVDFRLSCYEYNFLVEGDCQWAFRSNDNFKVLKIK
jgi:hypothetical protein